MFKDKTLLITGGTGSFGNAVLNRFLSTDIKEIRIFSRDEKKQDDMRNQLKNPKVKFYIGDVRNYNSIELAMRGVDYVFHAETLKKETMFLGSKTILMLQLPTMLKRLSALVQIRLPIQSTPWGLVKPLWKKSLLQLQGIYQTTVQLFVLHGTVM